MKTFLSPYYKQNTNMVEIEHLLVMQHFRVIYFRRECIPRNLSDKWDIPQLYHEKGLCTDLQMIPGPQMIPKLDRK